MDLSVENCAERKRETQRDRERVSAKREKEERAREYLFRKLVRGKEPPAKRYCDLAS